MENHHAYLLIGRKPEVVGELSSYLEENGFKIVGNPDYALYEFETLGVDDARKLREYANKKPFGEKMIVAIVANFIGHEAQNALLKALEEPAENVSFFIVVPEIEILLPTVRSRLIQISSLGVKNDDNKDVLQFLKSSAEERLKILSGFLSHESESKKSDLITFINQIEGQLSTKAKNNKNIQKALLEILHLKTFLFDRSPSIKMIAEYLALQLPVVK
jgi:DNA polymerase III delta prime subunit